MIVLFSQHWDVDPNKESEYSNFIMTSYMKSMERLNLLMIGGYYVAVGAGPRIIGVCAAQSLNHLDAALSSEEYQDITSQLMLYVSNYYSRVLAPTGRVEMEDCKIQTGIWKFNQYWNIVPGKEKEYTDFIKGEYLPAMDALKVPVTGGWRVIIGSGPYILSESSAKNIVDIAKAVEAPDYRVLLKKLKSRYVTDFQSRILAPTGRIDIPYFMNKVMASL